MDPAPPPPQDASALPPTRPPLRAVWYRRRYLLLAMLVVVASVTGIALAGPGAPPAPPPPPRTETELRTLVHDPGRIARGRELWGNCVGCHGIDGHGVQGPNLCDDYWLHGSDVTDLCTSISEGVPLKGMPSWRITGAMGPDDILALAAYVVSLHGSDHGQGKAPEGVLAPISY